MSYHHLNRTERKKLEAMNRQGNSVRKMAQKLGRSPGTISRELKRNRGPDGKYRAVAAEKAYGRRRKNCVRRRLYQQANVVAYVEEKMMLCWSPEQIAGRIRLEYPEDRSMRVSATSIYRWLSDDLLARSVELRIKLRHHGRKHGEKRGHRVNARELKTRCKEALKRSRLGDWEVDSIVWGRVPHSIHLLNIVDRKSRYCCLALLHRVTKPEMMRAFSFFFEDGLLPLFTMTSDLGAEFNCHREFEEKFGALFYYTRPKSPWQKPTVENQNGLIRQFFPRAIDPCELTHQQVQHVMDLLNNRPRKCLGFKTPAEVLHST